MIVAMILALVGLAVLCTAERDWHLLAGAGLVIGAAVRVVSLFPAELWLCQGY